MPLLVRFVILNFAAGTAIGVAVVATAFFGSSGAFGALGAANDRLLAFTMLAMTVAPSFGLGFLGTALAFLALDE
ncbi:hypothetical protein [Aquibium microcysteis]|uniref:hypothetical protein n=1 Tax=Aquibium microcysteis TaxID=675281 RepID=UPI00165D1997|nr:hypothetical protein [Aquibium microcysteis]